VKEFVTALKAVTEEDESIEFTLDGHVITCYRPSAAQFAVAAASVSRHRPVEEKLAGIIDFFVEILDEDSRGYIEGRLLDRNDPFGLDEVDDIMGWMVEEWSARPTQSPTGSTPSRQNGGRKSTRPTSKSTSSASARTGS